MWLFEKPIAHRGLHNETLTENSMGAFKNAAENGYIIELDIHLLKTGEVVVFHDPSLLRVCGKDVKIWDLTLDDIKNGDYLLPSGERIPLLSEVVEFCEQTNTYMLLEIKIDGKKGKEEAVLKVIKGHERLIAIQNFNFHSIIWFKKHAPEFVRGCLTAPVLIGMVKRKFKKIQPAFIAHHLGYLKPSIKKFAEKKNIGFITFTVRSEQDLQKAIAAGVDNIIVEKTDISNFKPSMK